MTFSLERRAACEAVGTAFLLAGIIGADSFAGIRPADAPAFIVAQIIGALTAFAFAAWLEGPTPSTRRASLR